MQVWHDFLRPPTSPLLCTVTLTHRGGSAAAAGALHHMVHGLQCHRNAWRRSISAGITEASGHTLLPQDVNTANQGRHVVHGWEVRWLLRWTPATAAWLTSLSASGRKEMKRAFPPSRASPMHHFLQAALPRALTHLNVRATGA